MKTVAEAIWNVCEDTSNVNHIIIQIQNINQFTFNVSIVLLIAALGDDAKTAKGNEMSLHKLNAMVERIEQLDIFKNKNDREVLLDFLCLFQTFQRLVSTPAIRDDSIKTVLKIQPNQLVRIKNHLQTVLLRLNKSISDETELKENTTISYCIQLVLNNMDSFDSNLF